MKASRLARFVCAAGIVSACVVGLAGCSENSNPSGLTGGTAATINGVEIPEDTVTNYVQSFRATYGMDTEDSWGEWLAENNMTPESVREEVINYYVSQELVKQGAQENGAEVDSAKVDETIAKMKANYDSEEAWQEALTKANTTEEAYRESVVLSLTEASLKEAVGKGEAPTDEELLEYCAMYDGSRRSSHILFNSEDEATAQEVLDKINSGELDFVDAVKEYSQDAGTAENDGDVGWDNLLSLDTDYKTALGELDKDQISGLVESQFGWHIIKCTDLFEVPEGGLTSTDQVPTEILESVRTSLQSQKDSEAFSNWYTEYKESADLVINEMPSNVPYNVDMSKYQTEDSSDDAATDGSTDGNADGAGNAANGTDAADGTDGDASNGDGTNASDAADGQTSGGTDDGADGASADEGSADEGASNNQQPAEAA